MAVVGRRSSSVCPMPVFHHEAMDLRRVQSNSKSLLTTNGQCLAEKSSSDWDRPIGYGAFGVVWWVMCSAVVDCGIVRWIEAIYLFVLKITLKKQINGHGSMQRIVVTACFFYFCQNCQHDCRRSLVTDCIFFGVILCDVI